MTSRVDDGTGEAARRATSLIVPAVRILRIPTAVLVFVPVPFLLVMAAFAIAIGGVAGLLAGLVTAVPAVVVAGFAWQRRQVLEAVSDPGALGTELGLMVTLSDRADEARGVLEQLAGGGGARVFSRLRGAWRGATMPGRWIEAVDDLPRARQFAPPRIGVTVWLASAMLWVVPVSVLGAVLLGIAALARSL